jgi:uncharacterized protein (TIGR02145 family)
MKNPLLFIVFMTVVLSLYTTRIYGSLSYLNEPGSGAVSLFEPAPSPPECEYTIYGDVNGDDEVNVLDVITMVNYIMGGSPDPFDMEAADMNADGVINILDVIFVSNLIQQTPGMLRPGTPTVSYTGQTYNTVLIGGQCWFKENLNAGTMVISSSGGYKQTNNGTIEKYCFNNDAAKCAVYGGLYEWPEAMKYQGTSGAQGICPPGWHLPSDVDFTVLTNYLGGQGEAGGKMKEAGLVHWQAPNTGATNASGFTALPGGYRLNTDGSFTGLGQYGIFWSSSASDAASSWDRYMFYTNDDATRGSAPKGNGFSVRCLKNCVPQPSQASAGADQLELQNTYAFLAGNTPGCGTGVWHIISGTGGFVVDTLNPQSGFQGIQGNAYTLAWIISTFCGSSADTVLISFAELFGQPCEDIEEVLYEGRTYNTVQIGNQCWLKENMNVGDMIFSETGGAVQTDNGIIEKFCYNNDTANCTVFGGLYQWDEAMQYATLPSSQGICPLGWHIPSDFEWKVLEGYADSQYPVGDPVWDNDWWRGFNAGGNLKDTTTVMWLVPNTGATNMYGFSGLPGGRRDKTTGSFIEKDSSAYFWTSSMHDTEYTVLRLLDFEHKSILRYSYANQPSGYSIRCIRGCVPQPTPASAGPDQFNVPGNQATLAANTPINGTGVWHIVSGTGGIVLDTLNPLSTFQGLVDSAYHLTWTITTDCSSSTDTVMISFIFDCGDLLTDFRDGQTYATVLIGTQCWMADNINIGSRINSDEEGYQQADNNTIEKYCYNNDPAQCEVYGGLYEWPEAMQYVTLQGAQGICPPNWHIPTDSELKTLTGTIDSQYPVGDPEWGKVGKCGSDAGGKMKETGLDHWNEPNTGATNSSGFTGLPGGYRNIYDGGFFEINELGAFWSSTQNDTQTAWSRYLNYDDARVSRFVSDKINGFSVRCVK